MGELRTQILAQKPTEQQKAAIFTDDLEFLLRAAPGSGKTWTACRRFAWRGANWPYSVGGLALLSFTNAAIREFKAEIIRMAKQCLLSDPNYIGTFDAFIDRFLMGPFGHLLCGSSKRPKLFIAERTGDRNNRALIVWHQTKDGEKSIPIPAWEIHPAIDDGKLYFRASEQYRNQKLDFQKSAAAVRALLDTGRYTHEHRSYWAYKLLEERPHIATRIAKRFPEIIVDEAQDSNYWFLTLLGKFRSGGSKLTIVGDPDQCIYEYNMASPSSLMSLKNQWGITEMPLDLSFRCNSHIALAARNFGDNRNFYGCTFCDDASHRPFIFKDSCAQFSASITVFKRMLDSAGITRNSSALLCRGRDLLANIQGGSHCNLLEGKAKLLAQACFFRDIKRSYQDAFKLVNRCVRQVADECDSLKDFWEKVDEFPESEEAQKVRLAIWRFVKSPTKLPNINLSGEDWLATIRTTFKELLVALDITVTIQLNRHLTLKGLKNVPKTASLCNLQNSSAQLRHDLVHQVKGESLDAVLAIGTKKFWDATVQAALNGHNTEDRRIAYVAMTRARHLLMIGLPAKHFDQYEQTWIGWGFHVLRS